MKARQGIVLLAAMLLVAGSVQELRASAIQVGDVAVGNYHGNFGGHPNAVWLYGAGGTLKADPLLNPNGAVSPHSRMHNVQFSPSGKSLYVQTSGPISGTGDDGIRRYDGATGADLGYALDPSSHPAVGFATMSETELVISMAGGVDGQDHDIKTYNLVSGTIETVDVDLYKAWGVTYSPHLDRVYASMFEAGVIHEYSKASGSWVKTRTFENLTRPEYMDCSGDGRLLVGNRYTSHVSEIDLVSGGTTVYDFGVLTGDCSGVAYDNDGGFYLTTYEQSNKLIHYDPDTDTSIVLSSGTGMRDSWGIDVKPIPEPASLSLIGLFTGGIYFVRRFFVA